MFDWKVWNLQRIVGKLDIFIRLIPTSPAKQKVVEDLGSIIHYSLTF